MESQLILQILFLGEHMQSKINDFLNFCYNEKESIEFQLFLITVKCLIPYEDNIGCIFDINRYKKEIELFAHYMNGNDEIIHCWQMYKKPSNINDELYEFKTIPIVLSNTVWKNTIDEVLKAVTFYTYNKNTILNALLSSSAIYEFMEESSIESIEGITKERLINFSIKDFFTNNQISVEKSYIIDFEKERIKLISKPILFDDNAINKYKALNYIFEKKDSINNDLIAPIDKDLKEPFNNMMTTDNKPIVYAVNNHITSDDNLDILNSFSAYLYKLRKGTINPEKLKISDNIPDIKECLKQPLFNHPLLGRCKVIQRTSNEVIIRNKSGIMRIRI